MALYNMFEAMRKVNRPDQLDWRRVSSVQNVAWKTGTSYGSRDAWAVGLTPRYAVGVWVGNVDGRSTPGLTGARAAGPVLFDLINLLPRTEWFDAPGDDQGIDVAVCRHSGHRAGRFCAEVVYEKVSQSGAQSSVCPYCQPDHSFCLPLEIEHYYKQNHPEYRSQPSGFSMHVIQDETLKFLYPNDGSVVKIGSDAFGHRYDLSKIVIPDVITEIGDNAFSYCGRLEEIILPVAFVDEAKRIFGRELKKDGDKWTFDASKFEGFSF
jgi:penicillin-binding protein 1C